MVLQVGWALSIKGTEYKHSIEIRHNGMHTLVVCYLFLFDFLKIQEPAFTKDIEDITKKNYFNWRTRNLNFKNKV